MQKLVSIVLPVYNGEKYLSQAIDSVLTQTYENLELILVNDCSTDSSESIMLSYQAKDNRVIYVKNEVNSKLPASLNNGFTLARGNYYTWTSDDNLYHPDAIMKMVQYLEEHPDFGMVSCDYNEIDENGQLLNVMHVGEIDTLIFKNNIGACFLYRAEVGKAVGEYSPDLFLIEDYDYWLRISVHYRIAFLHEVLYDYRWHSNCLSMSKMQEAHRVLNEYRWANLTKYETANFPEEKLFDYFDWLLTFKKDYREMASLRRGFLFRHPKYIIRMPKQFAHDLSMFLHSCKKKWSHRLRKIARCLLGDHRYQTLKDLKKRLHSR